MQTVVLFVGDKEFFHLIVDNQRELLVCVCLNFLRTSAQEYEQMTSDPEQFVSLALDTCDKQKSKVVKTQAAKLIEALCDSVDGSVSFITLFCCQAINVALNNGQVQSHPSVDFAVFQQSQFMQSPPEIIAETCLVALTAISYILPRRADLVPIFDSALATNID